MVYVIKDDIFSRQVYLVTSIWLSCWSTDIQLIHYFNDCTLNIDVIYSDFAKEFDTVVHR